MNVTCKPNWASSFLFWGDNVCMPPVYIMHSLWCTSETQTIFFVNNFNFQSLFPMIPTHTFNPLYILTGACLVKWKECMNVFVVCFYCSYTLSTEPQKSHIWSNLPLKIAPSFSLSETLSTKLKKLQFSCYICPSLCIQHLFHDVRGTVIITYQFWLNLSYYSFIRPVRSFLKRGCRFFYRSAAGGGGGGGGLQHFFSLLKICSRQFSRHGVGVSSYITNLYTSNKKRFSPPKGGCGRTHCTPPPPPTFGRACFHIFCLIALIKACLHFKFEMSLENWNTKHSHYFFL